MQNGARLIRSRLRTGGRGSVAGNRSLTVAALNAHRSRAQGALRQGAVGTSRILLALALAWSAVAQSSLPPGTLLLARVKVHMREELARLPNCSCLETVRREIQSPSGVRTPLDMVRLEVFYSDRHELYASPGEQGFGESHPIDFVGSGTIGNGHFALVLSQAMSERGLSYEYKGEEMLAGRRLARFDYRLPLSLSGDWITLPEGRGTVGIKGSFWADPVSYDVVRILSEADEIPPTLPVTVSSTTIDYAHTNLGGIDFLLPQSADSRMVRFSGQESLNHIEFTHCHLYGAQSKITFGAPGGFPQFGASSVLEMNRELLPALPVAIVLSTRITEKTAVGTLIEGKVEGSVMHKKSILIPDRAPVRGRVRRLERYEEKGGYFVVALEFTEIEAAGKRYRFFASLEGTDGLPGLKQTIRSRKAEKVHRSDPEATRLSEEILSLPDLPGVGSFFVQAPHLDIPPGFRTAWKTRALVP